ncbi:sulfite exporter TauE/SafE family protein [uncultured Gilvimarinus sp.]|uniref:sulfite exporter TauE/SafE family protein n=1 Tax=uncultured Gilvimarinus sp. TaxID=1689143 RepID=UPI0030EBAC03|tara:strand:- start:1741 stop:2568 length:828 start_codon:yes stop_codon:yes gene_type:complete
MIDLTALAAGLLLGFFSSTHCLGMCGGIMGALTMAVEAPSKLRSGAIVVCYNLGRLTSYTLMGAVAGALGETVYALGAATVLRVIAALLLLAMALYLAGWWRGLLKLEALGRYLWRYLQPIGRALLPVRGPVPALGLGFIWGWLPCGLVYSALGYAMTQPAASGGALFMLAFGAGTLPAVLLAAFATGRVRRWAQQRSLRLAGALLLLVFAGWTLYGAVGPGHANHQHSDHHQHSNHSHLPGADSSQQPARSGDAPTDEGHAPAGASDHSGHQHH